MCTGSIGRGITVPLGGVGGTTPVVGGDGSTKPGPGLPGAEPTPPGSVEASRVPALLTASFVLAAFAVSVFGLIVAYVLGALVVLGWVTLCRRLIGGQTGDLIGALMALIEVAVLTAFMVFV